MSIDSEYNINGLDWFDGSTLQKMYGNFPNFDIILDHFFARFSASPHPARDVHCVLLCAHADQVVIGAWNPMLCPIWGFRQHTHRAWEDAYVVLA